MNKQLTPNINDTFFNSIHKEVWKKMLPQALSIAEVDFIEDVANLEKGNKVLDVMCGYGRHSIDLAKRGYSITANDNLQDYIQEIEQTAQTEGLDINTICRSSLHMQLNTVYDAVICMGNSFSFFNKPDAEELLKNIAAHLKQGGVFIINTWMLAEIAIKYFKDKDWFYVDDYKYIIDNQFLFDPTRIESDQMIITPDGRVEEKSAVDYIFTIDELRLMLANSGLLLKEVYSTPRKRKFAFGDSKAYLVAEKI